MSALGATVGLALATTAAVFMFAAISNDQTSATKANESNQLSLPDSDLPNVQFILYTRNNSPVNLILGDVALLNTSGFDFGNPVKVITHGFRSSIQEEVFNLLKDAYLETGDYNVIGTDWSVFCKNQYMTAMKGVEITGGDLAGFLNWLVETGVPLDDIHLIGHSLGAHVMGVAGNQIAEGRKVGRITGLDPAGPGYNDIRPDLKLDPDDGKLVDVVHTYMKVLSLDHPVGHVDFYPNGGRFQPGCPDIYEIWKLSNSMMCNHGRSYRLFAESIRNPRAFQSRRCKSVEDALYSRCFEESDVFMGQPETYKTYGLYYFKTSPTEPYSLKDQAD